MDASPLVPDSQVILLNLEGSFKCSSTRDAPILNPVLRLSAVVYIFGHSCSDFAKCKEFRLTAVIYVSLNTCEQGPISGFVKNFGNLGRKECFRVSEDLRKYLLSNKKGILSHMFWCVKQY